MEENARKISELGRNLYESVRVLGGHFDTLGTRLKSSLDAYNQAVGSLEGNVLVKARKFKELHAGSADEIKAAETELDAIRAQNEAAGKSAAELGGTPAPQPVPLPTKPKNP